MKVISTPTKPPKTCFTRYIFGKEERDSDFFNEEGGGSSFLLCFVGFPLKLKELTFTLVMEHGNRAFLTKRLKSASEIHVATQCFNLNMEIIHRVAQ